MEIKTLTAPLVRQGKITSLGELTTKYGWDASRLRHDLECVYANGCPCCGRAFGTPMGHGLSDVVIAAARPEGAPFYPTNGRWVCRGCGASLVSKKAGELLETRNDLAESVEAA